MSVELDEIRQFLEETPPFSALPGSELAGIPAKLTVRYARRGEEIVTLGRPNDDVFVVRSGLVDLFDDTGTILDRRDVGDHFGYSTLMSHEPSLYTMTAVEDSLLLVMHSDVFTDLCGRYVEVARFYGGENSRIRAVASSLRSTAATSALRTQVSDLMSDRVVMSSPETSIRDAAQLMTDRNVSSLLIVRGAEGDGPPPDVGLVGIITDRDLRRRVIAAGVDTSLPVSEVMTPDPQSVTLGLLAFEAMLLMSERGYHHLPVTGDGKVQGMVVIGDLLRSLQTDPVYATALLSRKTEIADIAQTAANARRIIGGFVDRGFGPDEISRLLTSTADAVTRRLLVLAEEKFGPAPVPYAFVVIGSQGRREMGLASDQDNGIVLDNSYDEAQHGDYFRQLSEFVCDNLAECGYRLCPGDMMAKNPQWRMTLYQWELTYNRWVTAPDPDALLHAQTFFDIRGVHGPQDLVDELRASYVPIASNSRRLHAHLAKLAAYREPPLGLFRGLVLEKGGTHANTLDVKKGGIAAVVQMARLFAVVGALPQIGTRERLRAAAGSGTVSRKGAANLIDAFDFLASVNMKNQGREVNAGHEPNNKVDPDTLSKLERTHLRDAFTVIRSMQQALQSKYPIHSMS